MFMLESEDFGELLMVKSVVSQDAHLPPRLVGNARLPSRDKSSIASNLAIYPDLADERCLPILVVDVHPGSLRSLCPRSRLWFRTPDVDRPCRLHLHRNMSQQR
jgi:hypothetical protein